MTTTLTSTGSYPPVTVLEAPEGVPATVIGSTATPDLTTVVMTLPPLNVIPSVVASEIMRALGKRRDINGRARDDINDRSLVPAWLTAHRVRTLIVAAPQTPNLKNLTDVINLCATSPTSVVFACDAGTARTVSDTIAGHLPHRAPWPDLPTVWNTREAHSESAGWNPSEPIRLPQCEFLTFYTTAERTLPAEVFAEVSARYIDALNRTLGWVQTSLETNGGQLHAPAVKDALATLLAEQHTLDQVTTVMHAAQAAFFRHGWVLKVDQRHLRSGLVRFPSPTVTGDTWTRLRCYRDPARAATVALYLAGLSVQEIQDLTLDDLVTWHHSPEHQVVGRTVPDGAAPFLRAQIFGRAIGGNPPGAPFLRESADRRVASDLRQASLHLDLFIGDGARIENHSRLGDRRVSDRAFNLENIS